MSTSKKRWLYFVLIVINIVVGLASRKYGADLPYIIAKYGGDTLYASCLFFTLRLLFIKQPLLKIAIAGYLVCIAIETLQLYQAPWMQKIRHTPPFGLILGYGFLWSDWVCYFVGTLLGFTIAWLIEK